MATPTTLPASFTSGQVLTAAQMNDLRGAFRVLQVVSTLKTDTFSTSSATWVDVTGLSVTITPSSTSSKVLVIASVGVGAQAAGMIKLTGGNTGTYVGDAAGSRERGVAYQHISTGYGVTHGPATYSEIYLDSPATTSATTYKVQMQSFSGYTAYVNRSHNDSDTGDYLRGASTITVMEISA